MQRLRFTVIDFCNRHEGATLAIILLLGLLIRLPFITIDFQASNDLDA